MSEPNKKFYRDSSTYRPIATDRGGCWASDRLTVDGEQVGWFYRQDPVDEDDSGWVFCCGDESKSDVDDTDHWGIYDVNTIANHDPQIVAFLDGDIGTRVERDANGVFRKLWPDEI